MHPEAGRPPFPARPWTWREPAHGQHFRTCSFCGSIHPDDLAAEQTWRAEWADRKYGWPHKFYVDIPNRDPRQMYVLGGVNRYESSPLAGVVPFEELTEEQTAMVERDGWESFGPGSGILFGTRTVHTAKFYNVHLSDNAVSDAVRETIAARSGLAFTFGDDRVSWRPVDVAT